LELLQHQTDEASLLEFGREAVSLLEKRDFQSLADRFGYALAFGSSPAAAIEKDLQSCVSRFGASPEQLSPLAPSMTVKYFKQNDSGLFAVVECVFIAAEACPILAELIVTVSGEEKYITLEEISLATAYSNRYGSNGDFLFQSRKTTG
jgi:hypothetical protein